MIERMEDNRPIRFLIDDNGRTVWKTFTGKVLVGNLNMGIPAMHEDRLTAGRWRKLQMANWSCVEAMLTDPGNSYLRDVGSDAGEGPGAHL